MGDSKSLLSRSVAPVSLSTVIGMMLGLMFMLAASGKVLDPWPFLNLLVFLTPDALRPVHAHWWIAGATIALEVFLAVALLLGLRRFAVLMVTLALLVVFTGVLVWIAAHPDAPSCGCMGLFAAASKAGHDTVTGLARNAAMIVMSSWLLLESRRSNLSGTAAGDVSPVASHRGRRGFSIVELLVCMAIIAVLLALIAPSLRKVRGNGELTSSLSMNRQLVASTVLYSADFDNGLPFLGTPGEPFGPIIAGGKNVSWNGYFRDQGLFWLTQVVPAYYSGPRSAIEYRTETGEPNNQPWGDPVILSPFQLSHTVFALPKFWIDGPTSSQQKYDWSLLRGTRHDDVRFPSAKGLIIDVSIGWLRGEGEGPDVGPVMSTGFADGSAAAPIIYARDLDSIVIRPLAAYHFPMFATRDGLGGRDRR